MGYSKGYLATLKGKKVKFKVVNSFPDLKVQFVTAFGDYRVKVSNSSSFANETIKRHFGKFCVKRNPNR